MAIESVKSMAASYQGSVTPVNKAAADPAVQESAASENQNVSADTSAAMAQLAAAKADVNEEDTQTQERKNAQQEVLKSAVSKINQRVNTEAIFGIHDATNRVTIKIVDKDSKKVIKELPPEKTLDMIAKVWEMAGLFVDEKR